MTAQLPLVSVVIPTRNRPTLVVRAVRSALEQSFGDIEVRVVLDGPDESTRASLATIGDPRLVVAVSAERRGVAAARNAGAANARGAWLALLDDDDEWLPGKLASQVRVAEREGAECAHPVIACRALVRSGANATSSRDDGDGRSTVLPRRAPRAGEPIGDYLLRRTSLFAGDALILTSTLLTTTKLFRELPFDASLERHEDLDWLLRVARRDDVRVRFVPEEEPLAVWHDDLDRDRISRKPDWRQSLAWIDRRRDLVTPEAYGSFVLAWLGPKAAEASERRALALLLARAVRHGKPSPLDLLVALGSCAVPLRLRRQVIAALRRHRIGQSAGARCEP